MEEILNKITEDIELYRDCNNDVVSMLNIQRRLSVNSFYLANYLAEQTKDYNTIYFNRKVVSNKRQMNLIKKGMAANKAEKESFEDEEVLKLYKAERDREALVFKLDILLKQVNKILSSLQQHISFEKIEKSLNN